jgi:hypothetical protein
MEELLEWSAVAAGRPTTADWSNSGSRVARKRPHCRLRAVYLPIRPSSVFVHLVQAPPLACWRSAATAQREKTNGGLREVCAC